MSVQDIQKELVAFSPEERNQITAFLFHLRHSSDADYQASLAQRLNDKDPAHWLTLDEFEKRLGQN